MSEDEKYGHLPIPTYEEATSSRPQSSQSQHDDDAERQGLLGRNNSGAPRRNGNHHVPTVESARTSNDSDFTLPEVTSDDDSEAEAALRRDIDQMEVEDPAMDRSAQQRARLRHGFSKRFASISQTFANISFPRLRFRMPSFRSSFRYTPFRSPAPEFSSASSRFKVSWPIIARLVAIFIIAAVVYVLVVIRIFPSRKSAGQQFIPESVRSFAQGAVDRNKLEAYLKQVSFDDHIAGTEGSYFLGRYIQEHFKSAGLDAVYTEDYEVYLNYANSDGRRVAITDPPQLQWQAVIEEEKTGDTSERHQAPAFHGLSKSGDVSGPLVYANYGSRQDFEFLKNHHVNLNGSVVLVRYYGTQHNPALKVKAAAEAGAAGCLIYTDPADDGFRRGSPWPDGPWRTADSVKRGSVGLLDWVVGDISTPGYASTHEAKRFDVEDTQHALVQIPSLPLGWRDAKQLITAIQDKGREVPPEWKGGISNVQYWTGDTAGEPVIVNLKNLQDETPRQHIRNIFGRIEGAESPEKEIYIGNHRDALCFGAADPGSGTAVMLEVVRILGQLVNRGWRPRRSLVFASWDAGEFNLMGSTEHVESRLDPLRMHGVAYLNVAAGVTGRNFRADASPALARPLNRALDRISDPVANVTLAQRWKETNSELGPLGTASDYVPFQDIAGMSSIDLGFSSPPSTEDQDNTGDGGDLRVSPTPAYPVGSCYDTFTRMQSHVGDPGLFYHAALAQVLSLLILELSDEPILGFDMPEYANAISTHLEILKAQISSIHPVFSDPSPDDSNKYNRNPANKISNPTVDRDENDEASPEDRLDFTALDAAIQYLQTNAATFMTGEDAWHDAMLSASPQAANLMPDTAAGEPRELGIRRLSRNARMSEFETHLLDLPIPPGSLNPDGSGKRWAKRQDAEEKEHHHAREGGIPNRQQFKHVIFGPPGWGSDMSPSSPFSKVPSHDETESDTGDQNRHEDGNDGSSKRKPNPLEESYYFPTIREALLTRNWTLVQEQIDIVSGVVHEAAFRLLH